MEETLFQKIIARKIPAKIAYEDDSYIAIHDIDPQAPFHVLVIPKRVVPSLNDLKLGDEPLVGGAFLIAKKVANDAGYTEFRTVFNSGAAAQQTVLHLHLHVLAGRKFTWPPG